MSHPQLPRVARGPCGSAPGARGTQAQNALKAERDVKVSMWTAALQADSSQGRDCLQSTASQSAPAPQASSQALDSWAQTFSKPWNKDFGLKYL